MLRFSSRASGVRAQKKRTSDLRMKSLTGKALKPTRIIYFVTANKYSVPWE